MTPRIRSKDGDGVLGPGVGSRDGRTESVVEGAGTDVGGARHRRARAGSGPRPRVGARHRCQPESALAAQNIAPRFSSLRYGTPAYAQLTTSTAARIIRGADDENEMGVFHHLYGARREINLRIRLAEYLRVGLRAGLFYES